MKEGGSKNVMAKVYKYSRKIIVAVSLVTLVSYILNYIWISSGSNEWELKIDKDGVKVYSMKTPGASMTKFKGVRNFKNSLGHLTAPYLDESLQDNCSEWLEGCVEYKIIEPWDGRRLMFAQQWKFKLFPPFKDREMIVQGQIKQDPETKEVFIENIGVPNRIPQSDCCVRVSHFHNTWRYTPLGNGEVQVELVQDFDMGGMFPDFLLNLGGAQQVFQYMRDDLTVMAENEKYRNARFDFLEEYEE